MTDISELVASEIADFCAGLNSPGEPETPEEIQRQLTRRILPIIGDVKDTDGVAGMVESYETTISMLKSRIAELESRTVKLPESFYPDGDIDCPLVLNEHEVIEVIESAGVNVIKWEPE